MQLQSLYKILSISSIILGVALLVNTQIPIIGFAINSSNSTLNTNITWAAFFIVLGIALYTIQKRNR